jgi:hypothetical protein
MKYWASVAGMLLGTILLYALTINDLMSKDIDWSKYDLPDLGKDKMWCMFTNYVPINEQEQIYMCSYECENGMILNTPGKGGCPRDVKERRW